MSRKPTSPGEILYQEFLLPMGLTQKSLADHIGCDYKFINRIINEKAAVSTEMALKLASAFNTSPDFWLNAQMTLELWELRGLKTKIKPIASLRRSSRKKLVK